MAAGIAIALIFVALNYRAYDGFFQDDELDTLAWAPHLPASDFAIAFVKPLFLSDNFRPVGHVYFAMLGRLFGEYYPPWVTPIFAIHFITGLLIFSLARRMSIGIWHAVAGVAFFTLSASIFDAYWKPMYIFDILCTSFCLASILFYSHRRWVLSFFAFWCAYKSKELAVMLPLVLFAWERWFGERKYLRLLPFFAVSLSFGLQGLLRNPNRDNDYTFRFTWKALTETVPFYAGRVLLFPGRGGLFAALLAVLFAVLLVVLLLLRDRRIWFGLGAAACFAFMLFFLPGRLREAYLYLPLACVTLALTASAAHVKPAWAWIALACWMPHNVHYLNAERHAKLAADDEDFVFVTAINEWAAKHPAISTLVYDRPPRGYHHWGVTAAWDIAHRNMNLPAYYFDWPEAKKVMANETVAYGTWDAAAGQLILRIRPPGL